MTTYVAFVDESGCKLKASTPPTDSADFGIAVAIVMPKAEADSFTSAIRDRLPSVLVGDLHMADADPKSQHAAREAVFSVAVERQVWVVYEAITAKGFHHAEHAMPKETKQRAQAARRSLVKVGNSHHNPSAHASLLGGLFLKVLAQVADRETAADRSPRDAKVTFFLDQVDDPILSEARWLVAEIESAEAPRERRVTGFDPATDCVVEGSIQSSIEGLPRLEIPPCTFAALPKTHHGVFAADVTANALYHQLRELVGRDGPCARLNQADAVSDFALSNLMTAFCDFDFSDTVYGFGSCSQDDEETAAKSAPAGEEQAGDSPGSHGTS